jgi:hypothetical protein
MSKANAYGRPGKRDAQRFKVESEEFDCCLKELVEGNGGKVENVTSILRDR